jgi:two-component system chemotaxis response regulator CheY
MAYNILIIDDSLVVRKVLKKTLGMTKLKIDKFFEASNGKQGLELLQSNWVDLVFLDINMPVMNGMEFMHLIHSDPVLNNTPVIVLSTEGSKERIQELESIGIKSFIRKPVSAEVLADTFIKILGKQNDE